MKRADAEHRNDKVRKKLVLWSNADEMTDEIGSINTNCGTCGVVWYDVRDQDVDDARTEGNSNKFRRFSIIAWRYLADMVVADIVAVDCIASEFEELEWSDT